MSANFLTLPHGHVDPIHSHVEVTGSEFPRAPQFCREALTGYRWNSSGVVLLYDRCSSPNPENVNKKWIPEFKKYFKSLKTFSCPSLNLSFKDMQTGSIKFALSSKGLLQTHKMGRSRVSSHCH